MKRLVLFVEGEGEADAMPILVRRILTDQNAWASGSVLLDDKPFRVGHITKLLKNECGEWKRKLGASSKRRDLGGVLLVLDGDVERIGGSAFCAADVAHSLARASRDVGGGSLFSVAVAFARQEFESWLIAGVGSLAGKRLRDGRLIKANAKAPDGNLEESPRNAKGWLSGVLDGGYKPTRDQAALAELVDIQAIRDRNVRSFRRLESAVRALVIAIRDNNPIVSPIR